MNIVKNDIWNFLINNKLPIIIYGMGNGADKIINELEKFHINIYGIIASDEFVRGQIFRNFVVKKLSDIEKEIDDFIIITAFGTQRKDVIQNIIDISKRHTLFSVDVPVYGSNIFDYNFYTNHKSQLETVYNLLYDKKSKQVFENEINFKLSGKLDYLFECFSEKNEVFQNIIKLGKNENYLDLGAYRGDTIDEFLHYTDGNYNSITALEPDKKNFAKLKEYTKNLSNIKIFKMGIWYDDCDLTFNSSFGRGSSLNSSGSQNVCFTKIDTLFKKQKLTYLKLDVEGCEFEALNGGKLTLMRDKPMLNIALYHRSEDIFKLPLFIHSINPNYRFYIRQHPHIPAWDLNLYAI